MVAVVLEKMASVGQVDSVLAYELPVNNKVSVACNNLGSLFRRQLEVVEGMRMASVDQFDFVLAHY